MPRPSGASRPPHRTRYSSSADIYAMSEDVGGYDSTTSPSSPRLTAVGGAATTHRGGSSSSSGASTNSPPHERRSQSAVQYHENEHDADGDDEDEGWNTTYGDFKPHRGSARYSPATTNLVSSSSKTNVLETVQQPILAREDWGRGEDRVDWGKLESSKAHSSDSILPVQAVHRTKGWVRRRWKWLFAGLVSLCAALALLLYFLLPRTPSVDFEGTNPIIVTSTTAQTSSDPAYYYFISDMLVNIDASSNYIPVSYSSFHVELSLQETGDFVAQGPRTGIKVDGRKQTVYQIPLTWSGNFSSSTDPTFQAIRSACQTIYPTTTRPNLNLTMSVESSIVGLIGTRHTAQVSISNVPCPIQFPGNST